MTRPVLTVTAWLLLAVGVVLLVVALLSDGNQVYIALIAMVFGFAGAWVGARARRTAGPQ